MLGAVTFRASALPGAPTLTATSQLGSVLLTWTTPGSVRYPINIYRTGTFITQVAAGTTQYVDVVPAGTYLYAAVFVKNGVQASYSNLAPGQASGGVGPSGPPFALSPTTISASAITLNWINGDGSASTKVYRDGVLVTTVSPTVTTYSDTGLAANTAYSYGISHLKNGQESGQATAAAGTSPNAPTMSSIAKVSKSSYTVTWSNTHALRTDLQRSVNGGAFTDLQSLAAGTTSFLDTGLSGGGLYVYAAKHVNTTTGLSSAVSSSTVAAATQPAAPDIGTTTATTVQLTWSDVGAGLSVRVFRSTAPSSGFVAVNGGAAATSPYTDTGLTEATTYYYHIQTSSATYGVTSDVSPTVEVLTPISATVPNFRLNPQSTETTVPVTWDATGDGLSTELIVRQASALGAGPYDSSVVATVTSGTTAYEFTTLVGGPGLTPSQYYAVAARKISGALKGALSTINTSTAPLALTNVAWTSPTSTSIALTLTKASADTSASYQIRRDGALIFTAVASNFVSNQLTYTNLGLDDSTTYTYEVTPIFNGRPATATSVDATTIETPSVITIGTVSVDDVTDQIEVNFTGTKPGDAYYQVAWQAERFDSLGTLVSSTSGFSGVVGSSATSPYVFAPSIDILPSAELDGDTVSVLITARVYRNSGTLLAATSRGLNLDAPASSIFTPF